MVALAAAFLIAGESWAVALELTAAGPERVIFDQATGTCEPRDLPDAPARAFRNDRGQIVLFAPNFLNRALVGPDLEHLAPDCAVRFRAAGSADPSLLDDRSWLHAFYTDDGRDVFALASASFIPYRHGMRCDAGETRTDCWLNGIAALRSSDGGATFRYLGDPPGQLAFPPPDPYRSDVADPPGFITATNIVAWNGWLYTILFRRDGADGESRNCLARAPGGDLARWEFWAGEDFVPATSFDGARWLAATTTCARVGPASLTAIRGLVFHEATKTFVAVYQYRDSGGHGFYYSTSTDLIDWSAPAPLLSLDLRADADSGQSWAAYPSIIDGDSTDRNFGTIGESASLFFVRFEPVSSSPGKVSRRLVSVPIAITQ